MILEAAFATPITHIISFSQSTGGKITVKQPYIMTIQDLVVIRHGARLDSIDPNWNQLSATPYDTPMADVGYKQASATTDRIRPSLEKRSKQIIIHCSPFLRCVQTALTIAQTLAKYPETGTVVIRLDAFLGEWQNPEYYQDIIPPPFDNHRGLQGTSLAWASQNLTCHNVKIDYSWPLLRFGNAGEYNEDWRTMYNRFSVGLDELLDFYNNSGSSNDYNRNIPTTVMLVTHGAGGPPLVSSRLQNSVLFKMGLASYCVLTRRANSPQNNWTLTATSDDLKDISLLMPAPSLLESTSTSTSCSSITDYFSTSTGATNPAHSSPPVTFHSMSPNFGGEAALSPAVLSNHKSPTQTSSPPPTSATLAGWSQSSSHFPAQAKEFSSTSKSASRPTLQTPLLPAFRSSLQELNTRPLPTTYHGSIISHSSVMPIQATRVAADEETFFFLGSNQF